MGKPKKNTPSLSVTLEKPWRDDKIRSIVTPYEEYIDYLAAVFNGTYNELNDNLLGFKEAFNTQLGVAKNKMLPLVDVDKLARSQAIMDSIYDEMIPQAYALTNTLEFHMCTTKASLVGFKSYEKLQLRIRRRFILVAWTAWTNMLYEIRAMVAAQLNRPPVKALSDRISRKCLKHYLQTWRTTIRMNKSDRLENIKKLQELAFLQQQDAIRVAELNKYKQDKKETTKELKECKIEIENLKAAAIAAESLKAEQIRETEEFLHQEHKQEIAALKKKWESELKQREKELEERKKAGSDMEEQIEKKLEGMKERRAMQVIRIFFLRNIGRLCSAWKGVANRLKYNRVAVKKMKRRAQKKLLAAVMTQWMEVRHGKKASSCDASMFLRRYNHARMAELWGRWADYMQERVQLASRMRRVLRRNFHQCIMTAWADAALMRRVLRNKVARFVHQSGTRMAWMAWCEGIGDQIREKKNKNRSENDELLKATLEEEWKKKLATEKKALAINMMLKEDSRRLQRYFDIWADAPYVIREQHESIVSRASSKREWRRLHRTFFAWWGVCAYCNQNVDHEVSEDEEEEVEENVELEEGEAPEPAPRQTQHRVSFHDPEPNSLKQDDGLTPPSRPTQHSQHSVVVDFVYVEHIQRYKQKRIMEEWAYYAQRKLYLNRKSKKGVLTINRLMTRSVLHAWADVKEYKRARERRLHRNLAKMGKFKAQQALKKWRKHSLRMFRLRYMEKRAVRIILRKLVSHWLKNAKLEKGEKLDRDGHVNMMLDKLGNVNLSRPWKGWKRIMLQNQKWKRFRKALLHKRRMATLAEAFEMFVSEHEEAKGDKAAEGKADRMSRRWLKRRGLWGCQRNVIRMREKRENDQKARAQFYNTWTWYAMEGWKQIMGALREEREMVDQAAAELKEKLDVRRYRICIKEWKSRTLRKKARRIKARRGLQTVLRGMLSRTFRAWDFMTHPDDKLELTKEQMAVHMPHFRKWIYFHEHKAFQTWKEYYHYRLWKADLRRRADGHRRGVVLRVCWRQLISESAQRRAERMERMDGELEDLRGQLKRAEQAKARLEEQINELKVRFEAKSNTEKEKSAKVEELQKQIKKMQADMKEHENQNLSALQAMKRLEEEAERDRKKAELELAAAMEGLREQQANVEEANRTAKTLELRIKNLEMTGTGQVKQSLRLRQHAVAKTIIPSVKVVQQGLLEYLKMGKMMEDHRRSVEQTRLRADNAMRVLTRVAQAREDVLSGERDEGWPDRPQHASKTTNTQVGAKKQPTIEESVSCATEVVMEELERLYKQHSKMFVDFIQSMKEKEELEAKMKKELDEKQKTIKHQEKLMEEQKEEMEERVHKMEETMARKMGITLRSEKEKLQTKQRKKDISMAHTLRSQLVKSVQDGESKMYSQLQRLAANIGSSHWSDWINKVQEVRVRAMSVEDNEDSGDLEELDQLLNNMPMEEDGTHNQEFLENVLAVIGYVPPQPDAPEPPTTEVVEDSSGLISGQVIHASYHFANMPNKDSLPLMSVKGYGPTGRPLGRKSIAEYNESQLSWEAAPKAKRVDVLPQRPGSPPLPLRLGPPSPPGSRHGTRSRPMDDSDIDLNKYLTRDAHNNNVLVVNRAGEYVGPPSPPPSRERDSFQPSRASRSRQGGTRSSLDSHLSSGIGLSSTSGGYPSATAPGGGGGFFAGQAVMKLPPQQLPVRELNINTPPANIQREQLPMAMAAAGVSLGPVVPPMQLPLPPHHHQQALNASSGPLTGIGAPARRTLASPRGDTGLRPGAGGFPHTHGLNPHHHKSRDNLVRFGSEDEMSGGEEEFVRLSGAAVAGPVPPGLRSYTGGSEAAVRGGGGSRGGRRPRNTMDEAELHRESSHGLPNINSYESANQRVYTNFSGTPHEMDSGYLRGEMGDQAESREFLPLEASDSNGSGQFPRMRNGNRYDSSTFLEDWSTDGDETQRIEKLRSSPQIGRRRSLKLQDKRSTHKKKPGLVVPHYRPEMGELPTLVGSSVAGGYKTSF